MKKFASFWLIFGAFYSMATAHTTSVPPEVVVEGTISTPTTWTADKVWVIESAVYIETDLTIEAGTTVRFRSNASLNIGTNQFGSILAEGLTEKPILFTSAATSPSPGDWLYINLGQHNASSRTKFTHCTFEYGGGDDWGTVYVGNTAISMSSCTIRASKSVGLYLESGAKLKLYENNSISECGESAVVADL
ncbi:MAG: hypothetical protein RIS47_1792, partial [Bacteroidota bacterium]